MVLYCHNTLQLRAIYRNKIHTIPFSIKRSNLISLPLRHELIAELKKLRCNDMEYINYEIAEMEREMHDKQEIRSIWSVLRDPTLLLPVVLVCALQGGQQLSGVNAVFFYSVRIFQKAGVEKEQAEYANLGAGCINLFVAFFSPLLMKTINRRPLSMFSCAGSFVFLIVLTFVVHFIELAEWLPYACIASVFAYLIFYQLGLGPIPYFIGSG